MTTFPPEYLTSVCEIKSMSNDLLATGVINSITSEYIEIVSHTGTMPILRFKTEVKLSIFNHKLGFQVLSGLVYISNRKLIRISDVTNILDYERRNFFRVDTQIEATATLLKEPDANGNLIEIPVLVCNISLGGALLKTEYQFESGEPFQLHITLNSKACTFTSRIHRVEPADKNHWMCGSEFLSYTDAHGDILCAYLFQCQRVYIKNI